MLRQPDYYRRVPNLLDEARKVESDVNEIDKFVQHGMDINSQIAGSALHIAVGTNQKRGRLALVEKILGKGANPNLLDNCHTPLHRACRNRNVELEVLRALVDKGAGVNHRDIDERTPLFWAAITLDLPRIEFLCQMGADWDLCDADHHTPLHWACLKNRVRVVNYFLSLKVSQQESLHRQLPLDLMNPQARQEVLKFLSRDYGRTPFMAERNQLWQETDQYHSNGLGSVAHYEIQRADILETLVTGGDFRKEVSDIKEVYGGGDGRQLGFIADLTYSRNALFNVCVQEDVIGLRRSKIQMLRKKYEDRFLGFCEDRGLQRREAMDLVLADHLVPEFDKCEQFRPEQGFFGNVRNFIVNSEWHGQSNFGVVLKKMNADRISRDQLKEYVRQMLKLDHPNVNKCLGYRAVNANDYFLLSQHRGETLKDYIQEGAGTIYSDLRILMSIARGLHYLHRMNMSHGNLKIHNVLLTGQGREKQAVLCDFWYRRSLADPLYNSTLQVFRAPEQVLPGMQSTPLYVDVYAFGILCYCVAFKKKEEDIFHRLHRSPEEIDQFVHQNGIRPLMNWFPPELALELRKEYCTQLPKLFGEVKGVHDATNGRKKDVTKKINDLLAARFTLHQPRNLKRVQGQMAAEYGKAFGGGGLFGRKKRGAGDGVAAFRQAFDAIFLEYFDQMLLPDFQRFYSTKIGDLPSLTKHDLPEFHRRIQGLIPDCSAGMLEYFEVLWKDMLYVKEYLKKIPDTFVQLMCRCWDPSPMNRWATFSELEEALDEILQQQIASVRTMSPEEIQKFKLEAQMEREGIEQQYLALSKKEETNYTAQDEQIFELNAILLERKNRVSVLKKVNDEIDKLLKSKSQLESELGRLHQKSQELSRRKGELMEVRNQCTTDRNKLNDREKGVKQKMRDVAEQEKLLTETGID